jgi:hypothetical protein
MAAARILSQSALFSRTFPCSRLVLFYRFFDKIGWDFYEVLKIKILCFALILQIHSNFPNYLSRSMNVILRFSWRLTRSEPPRCITYTSISRTNRSTKFSIHQIREPVSNHTLNRGNEESKPKKKVFIMQKQLKFHEEKFEINTF